MPIIIVLFGLFGASIAFIGLARIRIAYNPLWFLTSGLLFFSWVALFAFTTGFQGRIPLLGWNPASAVDFWSATPELLVDEYSSPFGIALVALAFGIILTELVRENQANWKNLASVLGLTGLGLFGVFAGNPVSLIFAWVAIDSFELYVLTRRASDQAAAERVFINFSTNIFGVFFLIAAVIANGGRAVPINFEEISPQISLVLLLSVGFRLGVLPIQMPFIKEPLQQRGLGSMIRLTPVAASLVLLARIGSAGVPSNLAPALMYFVSGAALYGALNWAFAADELQSRQYWILGTASLAVASVVQQQPAAAISWGLLLLLSGGVSFLYSEEARPIKIVAFLSLAALTALPLTPGWAAGELYLGMVRVPLVILGAAHALLLVGFAKHTLAKTRPSAVLVPGVRLIYIVGVSILFVTQYTLGWWHGFGSERLLEMVWAVLGVTVLAALILYIAKRWKLKPPSADNLFLQFFSFSWLYRIIWRIYRRIGRLASLVSSLLEGEAGMLWAILILALLLTLFSQFSTGA
jgi:hypothetical protein